MGPPAARHARDVGVEQADGASVGRHLARDQVEERRLPGAVGADDESALSGLNGQIHRRRHPETAESLLETAHGERAQGGTSSRVAVTAAGTWADVPTRRRRASLPSPGTSPSGMKTMIITKIAPSTKFQRSM